MRLVAWLACTIITILHTVNANVEKVVFLGPSPTSILNAQPGLDDLRIESLSPGGQRILETRLPVVFPTEVKPRGLDYWYLLQGLEEGRRYEVRICWPATQPTKFWLDTYTLTEVFDSPTLISFLAAYSESRQGPSFENTLHTKQDHPTTSQSLLLLRIQAAADFYSSNRTLMEHPPPVDVDIILDPFLLNVLPQSLGPTAIYITFLAIASWFISGAIYRWLSSVAEQPVSTSKPHAD